MYINTCTHTPTHPHTHTLVPSNRQVRYTRQPPSQRPIGHTFHTPPCSHLSPPPPPLCLPACAAAFAVRYIFPQPSRFLDTPPRSSGGVPPLPTVQCMTISSVHWMIRRLVPTLTAHRLPLCPLQARALTRCTRLIRSGIGPTAGGWPYVALRAGFTDAGPLIFGCMVRLIRSGIGPRARRHQGLDDICMYMCMHMYIDAYVYR